MKDTTGSNSDPKISYHSTVITASCNRQLQLLDHHISRLERQHFHWEQLRIAGLSLSKCPQQLTATVMPHTSAEQLGTCSVLQLVSQPGVPQGFWLQSSSWIPLPLSCFQEPPTLEWLQVILMKTALQHKIHLKNHFWKDMNKND